LIIKIATSLFFIQNTRRFDETAAKQAAPSPAAPPGHSNSPRFINTAKKPKKILSQLPSIRPSPTFSTRSNKSEPGYLSVFARQRKQLRLIERKRSKNFSKDSDPTMRMLVEDLVRPQCF
jgi:hypothetical protein